MMGQISAREVVQAIEQWIPNQEHSHEREFQSELQEHLDDALNSGGSMDGLLGGGSGGGIEVSTERGRTNADIAIDDRICVEMKRNFDNGKVDRAKGQIEKQREEYEAVIVVACGVDDMDGWRRLQNKLKQGGAVGLQSPVEFIHKPRDEYGSSPSGQQGSGGLFDF